MNRSMSSGLSPDDPQVLRQSPKSTRQLAAARDSRCVRSEIPNVLHSSAHMKDEKKGPPMKRAAETHSSLKKKTQGETITSN